MAAPPRALDGATAAAVDASKWTPTPAGLMRLTIERNRRYARIAPMILEWMPRDRRAPTPSAKTLKRVMVALHLMYVPCHCELVAHLRRLPSSLEDYPADDLLPVRMQFIEDTPTDPEDPEYEERLALEQELLAVGATGLTAGNTHGR